jgi:gluconate 2-dehydrogenase subunit 3-like protein
MRQGREICSGPLGFSRTSIESQGPDVARRERSDPISGENRSVSSRRNVLKTFAGVPALSLIKLIPLQVAEAAHNTVRNVKAQARGSGYTPKFFNRHEYRTLQALCQAIIPSDDRWGGALEAGAPEFIDLLTSESEEYQRRLGGGLMWLNAVCLKRFKKVYLQSTPANQKEILDLIAYRANAEKDASLTPGIDFFAFLRDLTVDAFFTSKIGIEYVGYVGNTFVAHFPGCPPVPGL